MSDETAPKTEKKAPLRLNLKCPKERELLERYYNERRVLDNSVPKEVIHAFTEKVAKNAIQCERVKARIKKLKEEDPEKLAQIRQREAKYHRDKTQKLREERELLGIKDQRGRHSHTSSYFARHPKPTEGLDDDCQSQCCSETPSETSTAMSDRLFQSTTESEYTESQYTESEPPTPTPIRKGNFFLGGMRF